MVSRLYEIILHHLVSEALEQGRRSLTLPTTNSSSSFSIAADLFLGRNLLSNIPAPPPAHCMHDILQTHLNAKYSSTQNTLMGKYQEEGINLGWILLRDIPSSSSSYSSSVVDDEDRGCEEKGDQEELADGSFNPLPPAPMTSTNYFNTHTPPSSTTTNTTTTTANTTANTELWFGHTTETFGIGWMTDKDVQPHTLMSRRSDTQTSSSSTTTSSRIPLVMGEIKI